jgi:hypothetical protein
MERDTLRRSHSPAAVGESRQGELPDTAPSHTPLGMAVQVP